MSANSCGSNDMFNGRKPHVSGSPMPAYPLDNAIHSASHHPHIPTQKGEPQPWLRQRQMKSYHFLFLLLTCCLTVCSANKIYLDESLIDAREDHSELLGSTFARLARSGTILVDQRPPPKNGGVYIPGAPGNINVDLKRRDDAVSSSTSSQQSTLAPTSTSSGIVAASTQAASPLPSPFDSGFSANITASCSNFVNGFLSNGTFQSCLPFSLLLQNSESFFQAEKSVVRITQVLDATCSANFAQCSNLMSALATNLSQPANCASDLSQQNPLVQQARLGLLAYKPLYTASCLRNPTTDSYCFADAITNGSSPSDAYIYYLPLNVSLPGGSQPTCDACLKNTLAVFESASADRSSALTSDYVNAAMQVNVQCGPTFANQSLAAPATSAAQPAVAMGKAGLFALLLLGASWLL